MIRDGRKRMFGARAYLGQALIFVHGYNISFDNAVRRAGQLAYDLNFDGPVFLFSWPSRESVLSYVGARDRAQFSADALREFIETVVAETKAKRIHIIAHSMGSVALNEALFTLEPATLAKLNIGEMVLPRPISIPTFSSVPTAICRSAAPPPRSTRRRATGRSGSRAG